LTWVRKIQKFAKYHLFADVTIIAAMGLIIIYAGMHSWKERKFSDDIVMFNPHNYLIFLGTAIYTFEGIGIVLPVKDTCKNPQDYPKILTTMMVFLIVIFIIFGLFNYFSYGAAALSTAPLITRLLPTGSLPVEIILLLFIVNLFISYPLVIHPANMILEGALYSKMPQSKIRKWLKNSNRAILTAITI
jgi:solute carrier family 36 (proton-coupled amino acid transporter)